VTVHANKVLLERFSVQPSIVHLALKPYTGLSLKNVMEGDETSMKHGTLVCLSPGNALRQGSLTVQTMQATLTISMTPVGHFFKC